MEDEKYLDHEVRISKLEDNDKAQDKRIEIHGKQIDEQKELSREQGFNIEIIKKMCQTSTGLQKRLMTSWIDFIMREYRITISSLMRGLRSI